MRTILRRYRRDGSALKRIEFDVEALNNNNMIDECSSIAGTMVQQTRAATRLMIEDGAVKASDTSGVPGGEAQRVHARALGPKRAATWSAGREGDGHQCDARNSVGARKRQGPAKTRVTPSSAVVAPSLMVQQIGAVQWVMPADGSVAPLDASEVPADEAQGTCSRRG